MDSRHNSLGDLLSVTDQLRGPNRGGLSLFRTITTITCRVGLLRDPMDGLLVSSRACHWLRGHHQMQSVGSAPLITLIGLIQGDKESGQCPCEGVGGVIRVTCISLLPTTTLLFTILSSSGPPLSFSPSLTVLEVFYLLTRGVKHNRSNYAPPSSSAAAALGVQGNNRWISSVQCHEYKKHLNGN